MFVDELTVEAKAGNGGNGVVRAIFERGLPGQAVGTEVEIKDGVKKE